MSRLSRLLGAAVILGTCCACPVLAQVVLNYDQPDETLPGFKATNVYHDFGSVDHVSLFSGDTGVAIPLGPEYPLSQGLSWQLKAYQTAKMWSYDAHCPGPGTAPLGHSVVTGYPTLGAGWTLDVGHIGVTKNGMWFYQSPDGGRHDFTSTVLPNTTTQYFPWDSTHQRVTWYPASNSFTVEFPEGGTQWFEHIYARPLPVNGDPDPDFNDQYYGALPDNRWGMTRYIDRFNTLVLQVNYSGWQISSIVLTPSGTPHTINFTWTTDTVTSTGPPITSPTGTPVHYSPTWPVLQSIAFPTVGGGMLTTAFTFSPGTFMRPGYNDGVMTGQSQCTADSAMSTLVAVPLLTKIAVTGNLVNQAWNLAYTPNGPVGAGALFTLQLPTNGTIKYLYGGTTIDCPVPSCSGPSSAAQAQPAIGSNGRPDFYSFTDATPAVVSRQEIDSGGAILSTVTYDRLDFWLSLPGNNYSTTQTVRQVRVHRPDGNANTIADRYLFHVPLSKTLLSTDTTYGLELVHYFYNVDDPSSPTPTPIRAVVSCYDMDFPPPTVVNGCGYETGNDLSHITMYGGQDPRLQKRATWYGDDPASTLSADGGDCSETNTIPCWQSAYSSYDGFGKYDIETKTANDGGGSLKPLGGSPWQSRTNTTMWNPQTGQYWLLNLFTARQVTDAYSPGPTCPTNLAPCSAVAYYGFNLTNGFLQSIQKTDQVIINMGPINESITRTFTPDSQGNPIQEQVTASGSEFSASTFTTTRSFQNGLLLMRQESGLSPTWKAVDVTRDATTGVITASRDPNALATNYSYDALNRLTIVAPPGGEATTTYCYKLLSGGAAYNYVLAKENATNSCTTDDGAPGVGSGAFEAYQYDGLGRVIRQTHRQPNPLSSGSYHSLRLTTFNAADLPSFVSEWTACTGGTDVTGCFGTSASSGTTYANFDFLGRARTIIAADLTSTTKSFDDVYGIPLPILNSDFSEFTSLSSVSGQPVAWASRKDFLGDTLLVTDPANGTIPTIGTLTNYLYNALGKLTSVTVNSASQNGDPTQPRTFTYDPFGFLLSEMHPETGTTTYSAAASYDALGNVLKKTQGGHSYTYTYDAAHRLNTVVADGSTYASNFYDGLGFAGGAYPLGRLTQQNGYHPLSSANVQVVQNYTYSDPTGRLSTRSEAAYNPTSFFSTTESFAYNTLGLLATHNHARTSGTWAVTTTYMSGLPTQVTANNVTYVSSATYNPAGALQTYVTGNGVTTTINQDLNLLPRPRSIVTTGADLNFSSGTYSYDGAGNVTAIGSDTFQYDALSRLTSATYASSGSQYDMLHYDSFGNLNNRVSEQGTQILTTNTATNQLVGSTYGTLGDLTLSGTDSHTYDALSRQILYVGSGANERYFYDAAGERVARVVYASSLPQESTQERFQNLTPCRILDTRNPTGTYGGPSLPGQGSRSFPVSGVCGIPSTAKALALNVTTINSTATSGNVRLFQTGLSFQPLGTANVFKAGYPRGNQTFGSIDGPTPGSFTLFNDAPTGNTVDVIVDVQGYFGPGPNTPPQTGDSWFFTLRDPQNRPSTEFRWDSATPTTTLLRDHVYLGNLRVADYTSSGEPNGLVFYTNDHLGSPRFMTDGAAPKWLATFKYRAFGLALTPQIPGQGPEFAEMERDLASSDIFDHARFMGGKLPRFNSPDKLEGHVDDPQSWNRYAYARNNPLKFLDPDGRAVKLAVSQTALDQNRSTRAAINAAANIASDVSGVPGLAKVADAIAAGFFPQTQREVGEAFEASVAGMFAGVIVPGEASLLKLTSGNFRQNLMRSLGKSAEEVAGQDAHHMLPQAEQLAKQFSAAGLNVHDPKWGAFLEHGEHLARAAEFNADWSAYLSKEHTAEEINKYARVLAAKYDINW